MESEVLRAGGVEAITSLPLTPTPPTGPPDRATARPTLRPPARQIPARPLQPAQVRARAHMGSRASARARGRRERGRRLGARGVLARAHHGVAAPPRLRRRRGGVCVGVRYGAPRHPPGGSSVSRRRRARAVLSLGASRLPGLRGVDRECVRLGVRFCGSRSRGERRGWPKVGRPEAFLVALSSIFGVVNGRPEASSAARSEQSWALDLDDVQFPAPSLAVELKKRKLASESDP